MHTVHRPEYYNHNNVSLLGTYVMQVHIILQYNLQAQNLSCNKHTYCLTVQLIVTLSY